MTLFQKEGSDLARADGLELVRSAFALASRAETAMLLPYIAESLSTFLPEADAAPEAYRLVRHVRDALEAGAPADLSARYFEVWLLRLAGLLPGGTECAACGRDLSTGGAPARSRAAGSIRHRVRSPGRRAGRRRRPPASRRDPSQPAGRSRPPRGGRRVASGAGGASSRGAPALPRPRAEELPIPRYADSAPYSRSSIRHSSTVSTARSATVSTRRTRLDLAHLAIPGGQLWMPCCAHHFEPREPSSMGTRRHLNIGLQQRGPALEGWPMTRGGRTRGGGELTHVPRSCAARHS